MYLLFLKPQEYLAQELNLSHSNLERNKFPLRGNHITGTVSCGGEMGRDSGAHKEPPCMNRVLGTAALHGCVGELN